MSVVGSGALVFAVAVAVIAAGWLLYGWGMPLLEIRHRKW